MKISAVVPCYNEEENIEESYQLLTDIFSKIPEYDYELIFADNDSTDSSEKIMRRIAAEDKHFKVILNSRNFGPECNTVNAMYAASGDAVVLVMADRQDPYELIPEFIKKWEEGYKVVWGQKTASKESFIMYSIRSLYYKIIKQFSSVQQYSHVIGYGIYDKSVIETVKKLRDPNPILRNVIPNLGCKPALISYRQEKRKKGKTSYSFFSYFDTALNSLINTSKAPMKIMVHSGILFGILSFLTGLVYLIYKIIFWNTFSAGIAPLVILLAFFVSIQVFFLGIIGEYLLAVLERVSFYKNVIEKERINF